MQFDEKGREIPDPTPVEFPLQWRRPQTLQEQIRTFIRREVSQLAEAEGEETFEEADDFDVDDDFDPSSPWELNYDQETAGPAGANQPGDPRIPEGSGQPAASSEGVPALPGGSNTSPAPAV